MALIARNPPGRLHVITDETLQSRYTHIELARLAADGGADVVQFREKRIRSTEILVRLAREMNERLRTRGVRLVVNDRANVAFAVSAGVHLGRHDLEPQIARRVLGDLALIGRTANTLDEALAAAAQPIDYLGVGPVFGTSSKDGPAAELGLRQLERIVAAVEPPVIAIGSISPDRIGAVMQTGVHGVAVLSGVVCRKDPAADVARCREAIDRHTRGRPDDRRTERAS